MCFLRIMNENVNRTEERSRKGKGPEEEEVVGEEVVGGGEGTTADGDGVAEVNNKSGFAREKFPWHLRCMRRGRGEAGFCARYAVLECSPSPVSWVE